MKIYRPNSRLYLALIIVSVVIVLLFLFSFKTVNTAFTLVSSLGCGIITSSIVAWLVDAANCRINNCRANYIRKEYFYRLRIYYCNLLAAIMTCLSDNKNFSQDKKRSWENWWIEYNKRVTRGNLKEISEDVDKLVKELISIEGDHLRLEALHILPEGEIQILSKLKVDLQHFKYGLLYENSDDSEHIISLIDKWLKCAKGSSVLTKINEATFKEYTELFDKVQKLDNNG